MGDPDGIGHIRIAQWYKGNHVDGANPRMNARMFTHINDFNGFQTDGETGFLDSAGGTHECQDAAVVIFVHAEVEELNSLNSGGGIHEGLPLFPVPALAEIGHTFNNFHRIRTFYAAVIYQPPL
jgi:hypothetical protein